MAIGNVNNLLNQQVQLNSTQQASQTSALSVAGLPEGTFVLDHNNPEVPFNKSNLPDWIYYNPDGGNDFYLYKFKEIQADGQARFRSDERDGIAEDLQAPNGDRNLRLAWTGKTKQVITGYETEQVQVGTKQEIVGYEQVQVGEEQYISGYEQVQVGEETYQTGTETVQTGEEQYISGYEQVQVGEETYQTGTETVQTGEEQYISGYEQVKVGEKIVGYETIKGESVNIHISREVDGLNDTGAIGDLLTQGTDKLANANSFFNGTNFDKYRVSSLLGEDNNAVGSHANLIETPCDDVLCEDDMYVAGDPLVGGKGNNYNPIDIDPQLGTFTMYEAGSNEGRKVHVNANTEAINPEGNKAFTQYGFVVEDDNGGKTTAVLSGGQLSITNPDGTSKMLLPGEEHIVGDASDPVARFYYASVPGGENGTNEQRLVFEFNEKPTQAVIDELVAKGIPADEAAALRTTDKATFGFRIPDTQGTYRASAGVGSGNAVHQTADGVKTYYDAHFYEGDCQDLHACTTIEKPIYEDIYEERPVYDTRPVYEEQPTYGTRPIYEEQPVYDTRPVYEEQPTYGTRPIYEEQPVYDTRPVYEEQPVYKEVPVYDTIEKPIYEDYECISINTGSPLVFDLDGDGLDTTSLEDGVEFDINGDGLLDQVAWVGIKEGILAFDANNNGKVLESGKEAFGNASDVDGDGSPDGFAHGFEALNAFAKKHLGEAALADNLLDADEIKSLEDNASLRIVVNNEAKKLSDLGIESIDLNFDNVDESDAFGNSIQQASSFTIRDEDGNLATRNVADIWFKSADITTDSTDDSNNTDSVDDTANTTSTGNNSDADSSLQELMNAFVSMLFGNDIDSDPYANTANPYSMYGNAFGGNSFGNAFGNQFAQPSFAPQMNPWGQQMQMMMMMQQLFIGLFQTMFRSFWSFAR